MAKKTHLKFFFLSLVISLVIMGTSFILLSFPFGPITTLIISWFLIVSGFTVFIVSIISLTRKADKVLSIVSLVLSSIIIGSFLIGVIGGATSILTEAEWIPSELEASNFCEGYCIGVEGAFEFTSFLDPDTNEFFCECLDDNQEILDSIVY
jgi:hypothetical protein